MTSFDGERVSRVVGAAVASFGAGPAGVGLVLKVFCAVPGVILTPARRGVFRSQPEQIQIGDWRYEVTSDGRLSAAHLVNGIVLAQEVLPAGAVGPHIARALGQVVRSYGPTVTPNIDAALDVLESGAGPGF